MAGQWQGRVYIDGMLPFGLPSAPKVFNAGVDALELNKGFDISTTT